MKFASRTFKSSWLPPLAAIFVLAPAAFGDSVRMTEIAGRPVEMALVDQATLEPAEWPAGEATLTVTPGTIGVDQTVYALLVANGIFPDSEAFTLVYDLNPSFKGREDLVPGTVVKLPQVAGSAGLVDARRRGFLVALTVDPALRLELYGHIERVTAAARSLQQVPQSRIGPPADAPLTLKHVEILSGWFDVIARRLRRHTAPPLRHETLLQLRNEAAALQRLLESAVQGSAPLTAADVNQIGAIFDDVDLEMRKFGQTLANQLPGSELQRAVVVNIRGGTPDQVGRLRVYYVAPGAFSDPPNDPPVPSTAFGQLGSGQSAVLPVKNYMVWAAPDGDPGKMLTPPLRVKVLPADAGPITVDVALRQP